MKVPLHEVLSQCLRHFAHLDEANAAVHTAPVRYSPLTFRVAEALHELGYMPEGDETIVGVLSHVGLYEEDPGR